MMLGDRKCTPEVIEALVEAIGWGATHEVACDAAGINLSTLNRWLQEGALQESGEHRRNGCYALYAQLKKKRAEVLQEAITNIRNAAKEPRNWTASAWLAERLAPRSYGKPTPEPIANEDDAPDDTPEVHL